jgi:hypothetical protein
MSKKQTIKPPKCNFLKKSQKSIINFRTENANKIIHQMGPRFFSATQKDFFAVFKNGHFKNVQKCPKWKSQGVFKIGGKNAIYRGILENFE